MPNVVSHLRVHGDSWHDRAMSFAEADEVLRRTQTKFDQNAGDIRLKSGTKRTVGDEQREENQSRRKGPDGVTL